MGNHENPTIIHKIFETKSSFNAKKNTTGKFYFLIFKRFLLVLTKLLFWWEDWVLGYHSVEFRYFPAVF